MYIPLHVHTKSGSLADSILDIKDYVEKAKEFGLKYIGISDHGSMAASFEFYNACIDAGINPIIGCEFYECDDMTKKEGEIYHLVVIAKDYDGFQNLNKLCSCASIDGFYYKPRIDLNLLELYGKDLIGLSACVSGRIPRIILNEDLSVVQKFDAVKSYTQRYQSIFSEFYYEIQPGNFDKQVRVNQDLKEYSRAFNVPVVVTNDVHYLNQKDAAVHNMYLRTGRGQNTDEMVLPDTCYYVMDETDVKKRLSYLGSTFVDGAVNNTERIAKSTHLSIPKHIYMPAPKGVDDPEKSFRETVLREFDKKAPNLDDYDGYLDRLNYEMKVIIDLGYAGYFLVVEDYVDYAKSHNIYICPGRGSVCGCLVAFILGITKVDPVKYGLMFERFLSYSRKGSIPDIDIDFDSEYRDEVFKYVVDKYGKDHCVLVSTTQNRQKKAAVRDCAKLYDIPKEVANTVANLIPSFVYTNGEKHQTLSIRECTQYDDELKKYYDEYPDWLSTADMVAGLPKSPGLHAAGTIISPVSLMGKIPLIRSSNEDINATSLDLESAELAGFVKCDFLGLANLTVLRKTEEHTGFKFNFDDDLIYQDSKVWDLISTTHLAGLFEISSRLYKSRMPDLKPRNILELANCIALIRPPCIISKQDKVYIDILNGKREVEKITPIYDDATKDTYGILLYQEQVMQIGINAGMDAGESFKLMKCISKKDPKKMAPYKDKFYSLCQAKSIADKVIDKVWSNIIISATYLFNKSHAVGYAIFCYWTAYMRVHYPKEYLTNCLTSSYIKGTKPDDFIYECRCMGMDFLPLDANESQYDFTAEPEGIRIGLCALSGFGASAYEILENSRPVYDLDAMLALKVHKDNMVQLIASGAFNSIDSDREKLYNSYMLYRKETVGKNIKLRNGVYISLKSPPAVIEEALLGFPIMYDNALNASNINIQEDFARGLRVRLTACIRSVKIIYDKRRNRMAFVTIDFRSSSTELVVFSSLYANCKKLLKPGELITFIAVVSNDNKLIAKSIFSHG